MVMARPMVMTSTDSDGDGYSDSLEEREGTDPENV